jgi:spectinomycin phosphotransferase
MLEPPGDVQEAQISACLESRYGLSVAELTFLPLGADLNTAVYRVVAADATAYFLKLRRGPFTEATVTIPYWLAKAGMSQLIAPLAAPASGALWVPLGPFVITLAPFVAGRAGWGVQLSAAQWAAFGSAMHALHTAAVPPELLRSLPREDYTPLWRERVSGYLGRAADLASIDSAAAGLARLLAQQRGTIERMVARAAQLADLLAQQQLELCLCHGDIHAGNILLDAAGRLYLVDWDTLVVAPKERDLMFIGAGIGGIWHSEREAELFYRGYPQADLNQAALAYYRYERIVQDIAVVCAQLLETSAGGADRAAGLELLAGQFAPGSLVDTTYASDRAP